MIQASQAVASCTSDESICDVTQLSGCLSEPGSAGLEAARLCTGSRPRISGLGNQADSRARPVSRQANR